MSELHGLILMGVLLGGAVRGITGFGGPMVVIPLLSIYYPPAVALWLIALIDLPTNLFLVPTAWRHASAKVFVPLTIGSLLTLGIGVYALIVFDEIIMRRVISAAIIVASLILLSGWLYRGRISTNAWFGVGALSGLVLGATLVAVVTSVFLNAASRDVQANRANFIAWGFTTGFAVVLFLGAAKPATQIPISEILLLGSIYFVGCVAGTLAQHRVKSPYIRHATLLLIILIAASSLISTFGVFN